MLTFASREIIFSSKLGKIKNCKKIDTSQDSPNFPCLFKAISENTLMFAAISLSIYIDWKFVCTLSTPKLGVDKG